MSTSQTRVTKQSAAQLLRAAQESTELRQEKVWQERVTDWFYKVVDWLELECNMVCIAMSILDCFLAVVEVSQGPEEIPASGHNVLTPQTQDVRQQHNWSW
eukprot:9078893-Ditylum_brightwellii.AAC.1